MYAFSNALKPVIETFELGMDASNGESEEGGRERQEEQEDEKTKEQTIEHTKEMAMEMTKCEGEGERNLKRNLPQRWQRMEVASLSVLLVWTRGAPTAVKLLGPKLVAKTM